MSAIFQMYRTAVSEFEFYHYMYMHTIILFKTEVAFSWNGLQHTGPTIDNPNRQQN